MNGKVVLSIDSNLFKNPQLLNIGLDKWDFPWLKVIMNGETFRTYVNSHNNIKEIWIISNDDIEAINLAAAVKQDRKNCIVCLISFDLTGSLQSRANAANIDSVINMKELKERISAYEKNATIKQTNNKAKSFTISKVPSINATNKNPNKAFVLSILSASGGAGKSSVAILSSLLCQVAGFKTLLIDADFQFGDTAEIFRTKNILRIDQLVENRGSISNLKPSPNCPSILAPPLYSELSDKIIENFPAILESLKDLFDVIVINTGSYWNELQAILLERDSKSIFLVDQRPSSVNATKKALELCNRCGIATGSVMFAINKCSKHALFTSIDISCALQGSQVAEILDGGLEVDEFLSSGKPIELINNKNPFAVSMWSIMESILPKHLLSTRDKYSNNEKQRRKKGLVKNRKPGGLFSLKRA